MLETLFEMVKRIKKKKGLKSGKQLKGWVDMQPKKTKKKNYSKKNIGKKSSRVII
jgi:hypothetical protein